MRKRIKPNIAIFIIAYNAAQTLISAYKRIPRQTKIQAKEIYCFDDCSDDNTYYAGLGYKTSHKIKKFNLYKNPKNLGYGGNQKKGYRYAIKKNYDVVVMLHGDAQYAPERMPQLLEPFNSDNWNDIGVVMGSRMLGNPLKGGMPLYKFFGNKIITFFENLILGTNFSEFHSGYRAFNMNAFKNIPFDACSNGFHFDTQILILLLKAGYRIVEVPIPTYYGPGSRSYVNVFKYGFQCLKSVIEFRLNGLGIIKKPLYDFDFNIFGKYQFKGDKQSSHMQVVRWLQKENCHNVLDIGCANGMLSVALGKKWQGNLTGIEKNLNLKNSQYLERYGKLYWIDLNKNNLRDILMADKFDAIVIADVLEHLQKPSRLLLSLNKLTNYNFKLIISVPNFHYLPAFLASKLLPKFKMYKGPLDKTHINFYSLSQIKALIENSGYKIRELKKTPPPTYLVYSKFSQESSIYKLSLMLSKIFPSIFAYQFLFLCEKKEE
ncbi:hypothetical protein A3D00_05100 [Candidatus Woesebacteria bacterium RIFCSPHIGHO2_02_FULL_38_9]|nr:MAG: hypothetical protein A3D00_05100 [Candidatus Woesebacteria bacterium RIFCSPHIGHO2_02_FULL_38_9]